MPHPLTLLLEIQEKDTRIDQLRHRRASLPERSALAEHEAALGALAAELIELGERVVELRRSQKRLEDEVATLEAKAGSERERLYSGSVTSPRELQSLQEEIDGIVRRERSLEDEVIEVMEAAEPLDAEVAAMEVRRATLGVESDELRAAITAAEANLDAEIADVVAGRGSLAEGVPDGVLASYERLRERMGGVAVARLEGGQCLGCHLRLPATEIEAVRKAGPDEVVYHEECGRILVP